jgi:hypothetical protein
MSIILKLLAFLFVLAFIATIAFTWYYFYVFQPKKMAFITSQQEMQKSCLADAEAKYNQIWDQECQGFGFRERCRLPGETIERLDQTHSDDKNVCNVKYTEALKTINYVFPWEKKDNDAAQ